MIDLDPNRGGWAARAIRLRQVEQLGRRLDDTRNLHSGQALAFAITVPIAALEATGHAFTLAL